MLFPIARRDIPRAAAASVTLYVSSAPATPAWRTSPGTQSRAYAGRRTPGGYPIGRGQGKLGLFFLLGGRLGSARYTQQGVRRGKRVRLVCGATSMYTGLDGLIVIVRYHLKLDPCDVSVYVFRDGTGTMLKYIEWDG